MTPIEPSRLSRRHALVAALAWATPMARARAPARVAAPALLLAQEAPADIDPAGWLVSEKLDGVRALWDGQRLISRGGLAIAAPAWFVQGLPAGVALDGELWSGRGDFDRLSGAVRRQQPRDDEWRRMALHAFERPGAAGGFEQRVQALQHLAERQGSASWQVLPQRRLADRAALQDWLQEVTAHGGEGLVLHRADAAYVTGRQAVLQKLKPEHDADAQVLAVLPGQGRLQGRMGALRLRTAQGVVFDLGTGFTDAQREAPPGVGRWVSYRHRGHTPAGVPRFASFLRERQDP